MRERLRTLCKAKKTSFAALEKKLGMGNATLKKAGDTMQAGRLKKLADYFGVSMEYLLTGDDAPKDMLNDQERELLHLYRSIPEDKRSELLSYARYIHSVAKKVADSSKAG